jgi:hypothetical protein
VEGSGPWGRGRRRAEGGGRERMAMNSCRDSHNRFALNFSKKNGPTGITRQVLGREI